MSGGRMISSPTMGRCSTSARPQSTATSVRAFETLYWLPVSSHKLKSPFEWLRPSVAAEFSAAAHVVRISYLSAQRHFKPLKLKYTRRTINTHTHTQTHSTLISFHTSRYTQIRLLAHRESVESQPNTTRTLMSPSEPNRCADVGLSRTTRPFEAVSDNLLTLAAQDATGSPAAFGSRRSSLR